VAALFAEGRQVRGVKRVPVTFEIAPDRARWNRDRGQGKALGQCPDRPDKPAREVIAHPERMRFVPDVGVMVGVPAQFVCQAGHLKALVSTLLRA
jgi:hypothetical protein